MEAPKHIVKELKSYDPKLSVQWDNRLQRFRVFREGRSGQKVSVMTVQESDGGFRPLDRRVLETLASCDTWRFGGTDWSRWNSTGRREYMNAGGMKEDENDTFKERFDGAAEKRYHECAGELAERMHHALKNDRKYCQHNDRATNVALGRMADEREEAEFIQENHSGVLVWDRQLGYARPARKGEDYHKPIT